MATTMIEENETFVGSLEGFDKEMKSLVLQTISNGWNGRLSSNGHAILNHPSGLTVAVSRSSKNLVTAKASIRRVENQIAPSEEWRFTGPNKRILFNGTIYKCAICEYSHLNISQVTGHFVGNHVNRAGVKRKKVEEPKALPIRKGEEAMPEKWIQEPIPDLEPSPTTPAEILVKWLRDAPMYSIEAILEMAEESQKLKEENKKLRETLNTLIALAKEI